MATQPFPFDDTAPPTDLARVQPDRDSILLQLVQALQNKDAWKDRVVSSTGRTLVDFVAAVGAYSQFSIESAYQEVWPESAKNADSLYAAANFAGVRYNRKRPASIRVLLRTYPGAAAVVISPYTQFNIAGTFWFNRDPIYLLGNGVVVPESPPQTLFQGKIVSTTISGIGTDYQAFVSPEDGFMVSDADVLVKLNNNSIPVIQSGLWTLKSQAGAQDLSLPNGNMFLLFGNDNFGTKPTVNDQLTITYAVTFGSDGNNLQVKDKVVAVPAYPEVTGTVVTAASGGGSQTDPFVYKNVTPALWGAFDSSVTPAQYKMLPLQYPGVIDAQTYSQREINPKALTWMNNIKVVLLTEGDTPWTDNQWDTFSEWMNARTMYKSQFIRRDPKPQPIEVEVDIFCSNYSNLTEIKSKVEAAIVNLFAPRQGIIGFDFYRSDIERAIKKADSNIEYIILKKPSIDIVLSSLTVERPQLRSFPGSGGFLTTQTPYDYAISAVVAGTGGGLAGESAPAKWSSIQLPLGHNSVQLTWQRLPGVTSYNIWGRTTATRLGKIGSVAASAVTDGVMVYFDKGDNTPEGLVPVEATIDNFYAKIAAAPVVRAFYSTRPKKLDF